MFKPIAKNLKIPLCLCCSKQENYYEKLTGVQDHYMLVWLVAVLLIAA